MHDGFFHFLSQGRCHVLIAVFIPLQRKMQGRNSVETASGEWYLPTACQLRPWRANSWASIHIPHFRFVSGSNNLVSGIS